MTPTEVLAATIKLKGAGDIIILIDSDDDDPVALEININFRAKGAAPHINVNALLAVREYESWLIHSATSLSGKRGLSNNLIIPDNPDNIRGAKEWLNSQMSHQSYSEIADCAALTAQMDLHLAMNSPSFAKFCEVIKGCVAE